MSRIERWIDLRRRPVATAAVGVGLSPRAITAGAATDARRASVGFALSSRAGILLLAGSLVSNGGKRVQRAYTWQLFPYAWQGFVDSTKRDYTWQGFGGRYS